MKKVKVVALVAAVITALLLFVFLSTLSKSAGGPQVSVVTAAINIAANTMISADMVNMTKLPEKGVHTTAVKDANLVVGKASKTDLFAGEQILSGRLVAPGETGSDNTLAYAIKPGTRAVTVAVDEMTGLNGMLKPRDQVDIIAEFASNTAVNTIMVAENVTILAVDSIMAKSGKALSPEGMAAPYTTITLQTTPQMAMKLSLTEYQGHLRALLRSPLDTTLVNPAIVTLDSVKARTTSPATP